MDYVSAMTCRLGLFVRFLRPLTVFTVVVSAVVIGANTPGVEPPRFAAAVGAEGELLIGSLPGRFALPRSSPNGQWMVGRAFSGSNWTAPIYRSSDGVSWEAVPFGNGLSGANDVTIADDGTLYAASHRSSVNGRYGQLWRFDGVWTREAEGTSRYQNQDAAEVAASTSLRAITQFRPYSGATALLAKGAAAGGFEVSAQLPAATSGWALSVVGDRAFVVSSTSTLIFERGQPGLAAPVGDIPAGNARVYAPAVGTRKRADRDWWACSHRVAIGRLRGLVGEGGL